MKALHIRSASEQLADYLKEQIQSRKWTGTMPGETWLVTQLQVGRDTVRAAMAQLEEEGVLVSEGQGRRRRIAMSEDAFSTRNIRVRILLYEKQAQGDADISSLLAQLQKAGFDAEFATKSLREIGMDVEKVARFVDRNPADAWISCSCSRDVNKWFSKQPVPALAMYGRFGGLPMASAHPDMIPSLLAGVRHLIDLRHRRIVMFAREERRKPSPARPEQAFLSELEAAGIATGDYNLPDWEESRQGLKHRLGELFRFSPPTALIFQEPPIFIAARAHLASQGIHAPRDISLFVGDPDPSFEWCDPIPSHLRWDYRPVVRRVVRWAKNVAAGKEDIRQIGTLSEFVEGGTIGPVPRV